MKNTITVRNEEQKALLEHELLGQISDGKWENASPYYHWEAPCNSAVVIDPEALGVSFYAARTYNFSDYEFVKLLKTRMIVLVRLAKKYRRLAREMEGFFNVFETAADGEDWAASSITYVGAKRYEELYGKYATSSDFWSKRIELIKSIEANPEDMEYINSVVLEPLKTKKEGVYNLKQLKSDLEELKAIFKMRRWR